MRLRPAPAATPTTVTWTNQAGGDWSVSGNWSGGAVPDSNDAAVINTTALETVTHSVGSDTVYSLTVGNDIFALSGGTLDVLHAASFANGFVQTGGVFAGGAVTIKGAGTLTGGAAEGATVLSVTGTVALANYTLGGASRIRNARAINQTGNITVGDNTGVGAAIVNGAHATYAIAGDFGIAGGAPSASIQNTGKLAKTAGNGVSAIGVTVVSSGTISVASGDLQFNGPSNVISGTFTGAGEMSFAGTGSTTLTLGTATIGTLGLDDTATVDLSGAASTLNGVLDDESNGNTQLAIGAGTLTLNGNATLEGNYGTAIVSGSGALILNRATTAYGLDFGGTLAVTNNGDFSVTGAGFALGDGSGGVVGFSNSTAGTLQFITDAGVGAGVNPGSFISNASLVEKSGGTGTSDIAVVLNNLTSGTIDAATGSIQIAGALNNAGTITGAGQLAITGSATLGAGTSLTVSQLGIYNTASLNLGTSLTYAGILADNSSGITTVNLGGNTLTLTGAQDSMTGAYGSAVVTGGGRLATAAGSTLAVSGLVLGSTVALTNSGVVNQTGGVTIGDSSGQVARITNNHGATWNITSAASIGNGAATASSFTNAGLVTVAAGNGQATLATSFFNQAVATIHVASGSLGDNFQLTNSGTISGSDLAINGNALMTLNAGSKITTGSFDVYGTGTLDLAANQTYAGTFNDLSNGTSTIDLNADTLQLSGPANFIGSYGAALVTGSGTLSSSGRSTLAGAQIGGTASFVNSGTLLASGGLQIGDGGSNAAQFDNAASAIYDIVNDNGGISHGGSLLSDFTNLGLFEKTGGNGLTVINTAFTNSGTITVTSGTLEYTAGSLNNLGVINGVVSTDQNGDVFITHH